ncbi:MAG: AAA domain-containing protein [Thermomicrobiales bacterium]
MALNETTFQADIPRDRRRLSPTDVAQFINLGQCRRFLRLRLHEKAGGRSFMEDYGVHVQQMPALLSESGTEFESAVVAEIAARFASVDFAAGTARTSRRATHNQEIAALARELAPGQAIVAFQPRLDVMLGAWRLVGDVDVLQFTRETNGDLHALIADIKSSERAKVEHHLQVAFYHQMLAELLANDGIPHAAIVEAILYEGPRSSAELQSPDSERVLAAHRSAALEALGVTQALLDRPTDPDRYLDAVYDLVTGPRSTAETVAELPFVAVPFHLTYKCDWCPYNEFCMKWCAERDDLSLIPHLSDSDKSALHRAGIVATRQLANLKDLIRADDSGSGKVAVLLPVPGKEDAVRELATTWPVGPRVDELIHRARRYRRFKRDDIDTLLHIPSRGYGSLPFSSIDHNPNLIRIYVDAQADYLLDRLYLLGALVVASENGEEPPHRRRSIIRMTDGPPDAAREEQLLLDWIGEVLRTIVELAAPDESGEHTAPIHLVFYNRVDQRAFLEGLGRHATAVLGATPLYDFVTQLAAFDSPIATFLVDEIRELKNYPMVCQSLQQVAAHLRFDWNSPEPFRDHFHQRLFDFWAKFAEEEMPSPEESPWYTGRARFNSQIPLEYAYAAWGEHQPPDGKTDRLAPFRDVTPDLLCRFQTRRLEALEHIAKDFRGNHRTAKRSFSLPDLHNFDERARTLAHALDEFVTIERHVELGAWKSARNAPAERRVLSGQTLTVRYLEADQLPGVAARNRENERRRRLRDEQRAAYMAANPDATRFNSTKEQREQANWSQDGMRFRLRVEHDDWDCDLDEALALTELTIDERIVVNTRMMVDGRLPIEQQEPFPTTPRAMLYGPRATIVGIDVSRDELGRAVDAIVEIEMNRGSGTDGTGHTFGARATPFVLDESYVIDPDPNDVMGSWHKKVARGLIEGGANALYDLLTDPGDRARTWPEAATAGQVRFLNGIDAFRDLGALHDFEPSKRAYIGSHGEASVLLVQGPPGTGKSYTTAFALLARLQGAMAAGLPFRVLLSCKTHAATDVLLRNVAEVRDDLRRFSLRHGQAFRKYFDERLLDFPLYRYRPSNEVPEGVTAVARKNARPKGTPAPIDLFHGQPWCVAAATPGGVYNLISERWTSKNLFGHEVFDCLVLDEASQMNLPEAIMAALPLGPDGRVIVVGDHRQMPPIIKHDWVGEPRRTFQEFKSYQSLYTMLAEQRPQPPTIKFAESFRLHADMAEFLRREIYRHDGIAYHSKKYDTLAAVSAVDPFVEAVLRPEHPLVVVVHDEASSQMANPFEQALIAPVLEALVLDDGLALDPRTGLGVVVPHRKQRAALQEAVECLSVRDTDTGLIRVSAVNTVERFQGDERKVILISATESDPEYLLAASGFLLDPRRLTVAASRAKQKLILVAARSVFTLFSADEEALANVHIWKNLLRRTCTVKLWEGIRDGHAVEVWGNPPSATE